MNLLERNRKGEGCEGPEVIDGLMKNRSALVKRIEGVYSLLYTKHEPN